MQKASEPTKLPFDCHDLLDRNCQSISNMTISPRNEHQNHSGYVSPKFLLWSREYLQNLERSRMAACLNMKDVLSLSLDSLPTSSGSLKKSRSLNSRDLPVSHEPFTTTRESLLASRGSLCASRGSLSGSYVSLLGSSAFLPDNSFSAYNRSLDANNENTENTDCPLFEQDQKVFPLSPSLGAAVNSVWRRDGHSASKALRSSIPSNNIQDIRRKRLLPSADLKQETGAPLFSKRRVDSPSKRQLTKWSKEEDIRLEEGVKKYGVPNWVLVAKHVKTRNNKMCAQRWRNCLRPEIKVAKKGTWSAEEDEQLRQIVSKCDSKDGHAWELASEGMGFTRNSKQCRERWTNFLDPCLRLGPWTAEEDECLLRLHDKFGNAWKKFTSILIGRSAERIRRHYTSLNRKKNRNVK
jgi:hypothetical protein